MARITVEDCIDKFPSRFELVLVASNRARKLHSGENPTLDKDNDKNTVIALREIAQETLTTSELKNDLIEEYQITTFSEDEDLDEIENDLQSNEVENYDSLQPSEADTINSKQEEELQSDENIQNIDTEEEIISKDYTADKQGEKFLSEDDTVDNQEKEENHEETDTI